MVPLGHATMYRQTEFDIINVGTAVVQLMTQST